MSQTKTADRYAPTQKWVYPKWGVLDTETNEVKSPGVTQREAKTLAAKWNAEGKR